jgi:sulfur relay (sulfurtransferase) DsrF/TusC family protein
MANTLIIIEGAYRCTVEEQDDPVVWITHAMKGGGADLDVLLRGNAVSYAVKAQDASGLSFGDRKQSQPPQLASDISRLIEKGVRVHVVEDDVGERGLERNELVAGLEPVGRAALPKLIARYDRVWNW